MFVTSSMLLAVVFGTIIYMLISQLFNCAVLREIYL